jgi:ferredoxin
LRVTVDPVGCEANAICTGIAPSVFELDDQDVLHIHGEDVPPELEDAVRRAVDSCPKRALYLTEG